jgi:FKBP-type peptidyl-prolyl cis-trans isomerase (trigger factor)
MPGPDAEKEVRVALVLGRVAEAEKIDLSEEEVDDVIREWRRSAT